MELRSSVPPCHGRASPGHPRLTVLVSAKSWVTGPGPVTTQFERPESALKSAPTDISPPTRIPPKPRTTQAQAL